MLCFLSKSKPLKANQDSKDRRNVDIHREQEYLPRVTRLPPTSPCGLRKLAWTSTQLGFINVISYLRVEEVR